MKPKVDKEKLKKMRNNIQHVLRDCDIEKATVVFGVDEESLRRMNDQHLLNAEFIRDNLIMYDWKQMTKGLKALHVLKKGYTFPEVGDALCKHYNISKQHLNLLLNGGLGKNFIFCRRCGLRISRQTNDRTGGLCSHCFADTIDL